MDQARLQALYARVRSGLAIKDRDPLSMWHFAVPRLREAFKLYTASDPIDELMARGPNLGTKTETEAAWGIACLQKRPHLDGVPIPQWRGKVEGAQLVLDYPQQILSVQPAYERLLGLWPHHARYKGEVMTTLRVMPLGGNPMDESGWSVMHFLSQENRKSGTGVRGDIILFDEPPRMEILRELRKAGHAGRRSIMLVGATPTIRRQWAPILEDYGHTGRRTIRRVDEERAEVRWSLEEVADWVLSQAAKSKLRRKYATDPLRDAREHGDYCMTEGLCPFNEPALLRMLEECEDPEVREFPITREVEGETGLVRKSITVPVHILRDAVAGRSYWEGIDPSKGIESPTHDPGGILMSEMGSGEDVALYEGYAGSYGLGILGAGLARQYNNARVDPESNGGWSQGVLRAMGDSAYGNISKTRKMGQEDKWEVKLGFETTEATRAAMIEAVQEWITAYDLGAPYARCRFRRVIETMLDTILDEKGKPIAAPGYHDEFLILKGQSLLKTRRVRHDPNVGRAPRKAILGPAPELTVEQLMSDVKRPAPGFAGKSTARHRGRPRG